MTAIQAQMEFLKSSDRVFMTQVWSMKINSKKRGQFSQEHFEHYFFKRYNEQYCMSFKEIAEYLGISRQLVHKAYWSAMYKITRIMEGEGFEEFLYQ